MPPDNLPSDNNLLIGGGQDFFLALLWPSSLNIKFMKQLFAASRPGFSRSWLGIATLLLLAAPLPALAHAKLLRSTPADGDSLAKTPVQVEFFFNELLDAKFNSIKVFPAAEAGAKEHAILTKGDPMVDPKDKTHLTIELKPLPPGEYMVEWRVLSLDGHSAPGRFKFKVLEAK
jgi:methionine-rich copper-binding protein CopC